MRNPPAPEKDLATISETVLVTATVPDPIALKMDAPSLGTENSAPEKVCADAELASAPAKMFTEMIAV